MSLNKFFKVNFKSFLVILVCLNGGFIGSSYAAYVLHYELGYSDLGLSGLNHYADDLRACLRFKNDRTLFLDDFGVPEGCMVTSNFFLKANSLRFLFNEFKSIQQVELLRSLYPSLLSSEQDWVDLISMVEKVCRKKVLQTAFLPQVTLEDMPGEVAEGLKNESYHYFFSEEFYLALEKALTQMDSMIEDGDTVIAVGNTPQFLRVALEFSKNRIKTIPVAISGRPGVLTRTYRGSQAIPLFHNYVSQQGLNHYRGYLKELGVSPEELGSGKIYLLGSLEARSRIEFLIHQLHHIYREASRSQPDVSVILLDGAVLNSPSFTIDSYALSLNFLSYLLKLSGESTDYFANLLHVLPDLPPWKWHAWSEDPIKAQPGPWASEIIEGIREHFNGLSSTLSSLSSLSSTVSSK